MFAIQERKKQIKSFAPSNEKRATKGTRQPNHLPGSTQFLQRNLGNSYIQSIVGGQPTLGSVPTIQRKSACGDSCASCADQEGEEIRVQPKLTIGPLNDVYEREADQVAEQVMRMPQPTVQRQVEQEEDEELVQTKPLITPLVQRQVEEEEDEGPLQAKERPGQTPTVTPSLASRIHSLRGGGRPLPESVRSFFEPRFGRDFSEVRIHDNDRAAAVAPSVGARAFTFASHIVFAAGEYHPGTTEGRRLMAHELTHIVQQRSGTDTTGPSVAQTIQRQPDTGDLILRLGEDGSIEVLYGTQDLPAVGRLGAGFRCRKGRCVLIGASNPARGRRSYSIQEARDLLRGNKKEEQECPRPRWSPFGCCPPDQTWLGNKCGVASLSPPCPPERRKLNLTCCPPGTVHQLDTGCVPEVPLAAQTPLPLPTFRLPEPRFTLGLVRQQVIDRFAFNDDTVPSSANDTLDGVASQLIIYNVPSLIVEGHTDSRGSEGYNDELAERRAQAVKAALVARGVQADRITVQSAGESQLAVRPERSASDRARNRRVEFFWLQPRTQGTRFRLISPLELGS